MIGAMNAGELTPSEAARSAVRHAISAHAYECFAVRGPIREIAAFLAVPIDEAKFPAIVEHCSFDYMKAYTEFAAPAGAFFGRAAARRSSTKAPTAAGAIR